ncbi:arabinogalactan endo-1,4-beta-galactosidase [Paenibacillus alkaliterrae]|uniref:glycoside hydrolase family 53 protein n=1 Tax=Paenibacillus alkaliterrae TaxID=320909 RepID=UPI001F2E1536|nr:arabinogalactan endo-1,4-beta-galactosidase [Paenibacillus alkaliterrae]MCF2937815.1 arabinogalactan endo-1,4-beta-galactosidase [Paenibacillus alkaliterrae]
MTKTFIKGMDMSFLDEIEMSGGKYEENGQSADALQIMKNNGVNAIRLRIWNDPVGGFCNLERTLLMAKRIKALDMHFLLDFHYSDKWADPANQWKPKAWEHLSFDVLNDEVFNYTYFVLSELKGQGTLPDMVQIGNEITPGMLWNDGKVDGEFDTEEQWVKFTTLVKSGIVAAKAVAPLINIMIHIDRGGDLAASRRFFEKFAQHGVKYDTIGLSFYPWWHGSLDDLNNNLQELTSTFGKDINVVETAYPWTLDASEGRSCIVDKEEQLHAGYPATVQGQADYLLDLIGIIKKAAGDRGVGFYWWEPAWIPSKEEWSVGHANNWLNLTLFDHEGRVQPALEALQSNT